MEDYRQEIDGCECSYCVEARKENSPVNMLPEIDDITISIPVGTYRRLAAQVESLTENANALRDLRQHFDYVTSDNDAYRSVNEELRRRNDDLEQQIDVLNSRTQYVPNDRLLTLYQDLLAYRQSPESEKVRQAIINANGFIDAIKTVRNETYPNLCIGLKEARELVESVMANWGCDTKESRDRYFLRNRD